LVKKYVQRLRHKLGDDAHEPRWVASIHGVGYQFIGPTPRPVEAADYAEVMESPAPVEIPAGSEVLGITHDTQLGNAFMPRDL
jgi:DNA-binding winged helix-turn-helix (wHTH) protein